MSYMNSVQIWETKSDPLAHSLALMSLQSKKQWGQQRTFVILHGDGRDVNQMMNKKATVMDETQPKLNEDQTIISPNTKRFRVRLDGEQMEPPNSQSGTIKKPHVWRANILRLFDGFLGRQFKRIELRMTVEADANWPNFLKRWSMIARSTTR